MSLLNYPKCPNCGGEIDLTEYVPKRLNTFGFLAKNSELDCPYCSTVLRIDRLRIGMFATFVFALIVVLVLVAKPAYEGGLKPLGLMLLGGLLWAFLLSRYSPYFARLIAEESDSDD